MEKQRIEREKEQERERQRQREREREREREKRERELADAKKAATKKVANGRIKGIVSQYKHYV